MQARLDEVTRIVADLQQGVEQPGDHTPVHVRDEPGAHTLAVRGEVPERDFAAFLGEVRRHRRGGGTPASPGGTAGALYPDAIADEGPAHADRGLRTGGRAGPAAGGPGPGGAERGAVRPGGGPGPHRALRDPRRHLPRLGAWVAHHARPAPAPVREIYLVSYAETDDPGRFRTEVHWPIREEEDLPA